MIKYIKTFKSQPSSSYIFTCDMDARGNNSLRVSKRKESKSIKYDSVIDLENIIVVVEEIESWYAAGMTEEFKDNNKIKNFTDTEKLTKEQFEQMKPKKFLSTSDFMIEILKNYSLDNAVKFNSSFEYFRNTCLALKFPPKSL